MRSKTREIAVQTLYQLIDAPSYLTVDAAKNFAREAGLHPEEGHKEVDEVYLDGLLQGISQHQIEIDEKIEGYLKGWTMSRIPKIDLSILRLAFYEVIYVDSQDVPPLVAVDEAIDLAKIYSDDKSRKFISGVLASLINDLKSS